MSSRLLNQLSFFLLFASLLLPSCISATELSITFKLTDLQNSSIRNVVISAHPQSVHPPLLATNKKTIVIDQIDKKFISHVTVVQLNTLVSFPNHDQIHHHVYSFSLAKPFDIPLYKGSPKHPILFDKTGMISLGCNIHDWMSAYIYVVDTPYFSTTNNEGRAILDLPLGDYEIRYWHPNIDKKSSHLKKLIKISSNAKQTYSTQISLKKTWSLRRGPLSSFNRGQYR